MRPTQTGKTLWHTGKPPVPELRFRGSTIIMSNQGTLIKSGSGVPFIFIDDKSPEWEKAWSNLYKQYENHVSGYEVWQYMGTWLTEGTTWVHQFRHRNYHGKRTYVDITPTDEFLVSIPELLAAS